jgi:hypothetical protein
VSARTLRQWSELLRIEREVELDLSAKAGRKPRKRSADAVLGKCLTNRRDCLERLYRKAGGDWGNALARVRSDPSPTLPPSFTGPPPTVPRVLD